MLAAQRYTTFKMERKKVMVITATHRDSNSTCALKLQLVRLSQRKLSLYLYMVLKEEVVAGNPQQEIHIYIQSV